MGPVTINAANRADTSELISAYMAARREYGRALADYRFFGRGWENRWNYIEPTALGMVGEDLMPAVRPLADPDAQSASQGRAVSEPKPVQGAVVGTVIGPAKPDSNSGVVCGTWHRRLPPCCCSRGSYYRASRQEGARRAGQQAVEGAVSA
jgi:lysozyme family protein